MTWEKMFDSFVSDCFCATVFSFFFCFFCVEISALDTVTPVPWCRGSQHVNLWAFVASAGSWRGQDNAVVSEHGFQSFTCFAFLFTIKHQAHAQEHRDEGHFTFHLEYPFLNYDCAADANNIAEDAFFRHFDQHAQLQAENYLVNHEQSKTHGKLRGKHLRHALNWQNLVNAWQLGPQVSKKVNR